MLLRENGTEGSSVCWHLQPPFLRVLKLVDSRGLRPGGLGSLGGGGDVNAEECFAANEHNCRGPAISEALAAVVIGEGMAQAKSERARVVLSNGAASLSATSEA